MTGTIGRARIAAPVAIAAETPQIEIPEASGAAHSRLKRKNLRDQIDQRPVDQVRFDDGCQSAEHYRPRQAGLLCCLDAEGGPQDDDGCLDIPLGPRRLSQPTRRSRKYIAEEQPGKQRDDETGFPRQSQRPRDPKLSQGVRGGGDIRHMAHEPAEETDPKDHAETDRKLA